MKFAQNKTPLCKGRWLAKQDGGIVKANILFKTIPHRLQRSSLYTREPLYAKQHRFSLPSPVGEGGPLAVDEE